MPTITIPDSETLTLGRNGAIGTLRVDWERVPQHVLQHIWTVYSVQFFTDAANAKGGTPEERYDLAQKKLDNAYAGVLRSHSAAGTPTDPVEAELAALAQAKIDAIYRKIGAYAAVPKGTKNRFLAAANARRATRGLAPCETTAAVVAEYLRSVPKEAATLRKQAERNVAERAADAEALDVDALNV